MTAYHQLSAISRLLASLRQPDIGIFQDPPPTLPEPRIPIAEGNGGIRLKDISDPKVPVQVVIAAYQQIQLNDNVQLFWNGRFVNSILVTQAHLEQGSITLDVPSLAIQDGTPPVHYLITSANGANQYKSFPLNIRVKTNVPGGTDPIPSTPEVNENLLAVTGVPNLVEDGNADRIVATVPRYDNMTAGDKLTLSWGGYFVEHELQAGEVNNPVAIAVPRAIIEQAGAGPVVIEYEIRDIVNNWSLWSLKFTPDVEVGAGLLRAPDALDVVGGKLDLAVLGDKNARIRVRVYADMAEKDVVALSWIARPPTGAPIEHPMEVTIDANSEGLPVEFQVPNAIAKASAGGTVAVKYNVDSNRGLQHSRRTSFEVIGQVQQLPAPHLQEAVGNQLDPARIPDAGATATVQPWTNMASGDRLELFISGRDGNGAPSSHYDTRDITGGQVGVPVNFTVPKAFFVPLVNGSVELNYRVNGEESDKLLLQVVGQGGAELPAPSVTGVVDGVLDPDAVPTGTSAVVPLYQGKAIGDRITLTWAGLPNATYTDYIDVTTGNLGTPINFTIAYTPYIIGNLNSTVAVSYRVTPAGGGLPVPSATLPIQVRRQVSEEFVAPTVVEAQPSGTLRPWDARNGATVRVAYASMSASDRIAVLVNGHNAAASFQSEPQSGSAGGSIDIKVPAHVIGANQGRSPDVQYAVSRDGQEPKLSVALVQPVGTLAANRLPTPAVPQAEDGVLDLTTFEGDASITVLNAAEGHVWPLWGAGQTYWVVLKGTLENGGEYERYLANPGVLTQAQGTEGLELSVPRAQLESLQNDSVLTVTLKVAYDHSRVEAQAREFPPLELELVQHHDFTEDFKGFAPQILVPGRILTSPTTGVTINPIIVGTSRLYTTRLHFLNLPLFMVDNSRIEFTAPRLYRKLELTHISTHSANQHYIEFNNNGTIQKTFIPTSGQTPVTTTITSAGIDKITIVSGKEPVDDHAFIINKITWLR